MTIYLQRKVGKPSISFEFEFGTHKSLSVSDVVKLADVRVYQANADGSVAKDFNPDLAFVINNQPLDLISLETGLNTIHLGIKYGANKVQDLQMPIELTVTEKAPEVAFSFAPEPEPHPESVVEKEEPVSVTVEETTAPTKFEPTPVLDSRLEQGDVYVFYGDLLLGEHGPVFSKIPTLTVKIEDLLSNEEQDKIENFEKLGLKVYPIGVDGHYYSDKNLVTQGFDVDDDGKVTWVSPYTQPLSFTNRAFSETGFVGLRYELSFIPKFKPEPEVTPLNSWDDIFNPQPVAEKKPTPAEPVGDWGSAFAQPEPVVHAEPVPEVKPEPIIPPKPEPMVVGNYETPVSDGWGNVQSNPQPQPEVQQNSVDQIGNLNLNFQEVQPQATQKVTSDTYGGGMTPPLITPQVNTSQSVPQNSAFEQFTGETLSMTPPLLHLQPETSGANPAMNPNPGMNPNVGAVQPQTPTSDEDLDLQLEEVTQGTRKSKQGFLEKIFGTFKRSKKKKGGKGVIIGSVAMVVLTIGIGTGVVLYRNAGINSMKSTTQLVEKNLSKVNKLMKDKEITSEESVEIQQLITENANKLEAKTNNYFAEMERKRLVSATNEVTEKAKDMIDKQTGASSSASE